MTHDPDPEHPFYPRPAVLWAACIDGPTLNQWLARGHVRVADQSPGRGKARLFSARNVFEIALMSRLAGMELTVKTTADIARDFGAVFSSGRFAWDDVLETSAEQLQRAQRSVSSPAHYRWGAFAAQVSHDFSKVDPFGEIRRRRMERLGTFSAPNVIAEPPTDEERAEIAADDDTTFNAMTGVTLRIPVGAIANATLARLRRWRSEAAR